jgi:hypothetical protein
MCAEAVLWHCHRSQIAETLVVRSIEARGITSGVRPRANSVTPWVRVNGTHVTYAAAVQEHVNQPFLVNRPTAVH